MQDEWLTVWMTEGKTCGNLEWCGRTVMVCSWEICDERVYRDMQGVGCMEENAWVPPARWWKMAILDFKSKLIPHKPV